MVRAATPAPLQTGWQGLVGCGGQPDSSLAEGLEEQGRGLGASRHPLLIFTPWVPDQATFQQHLLLAVHPLSPPTCCHQGPQCLATDTQAGSWTGFFPTAGALSPALCSGQALCQHCTPARPGITDGRQTVPEGHAHTLGLLCLGAGDRSRTHTAPLLVRLGEPAAGRYDLRGAPVRRRDRLGPE